MNVNKININQSSQTYYIASDIYDVSYHNSGTSFASLSELLSSENLSTLIPSEIRCGGMTIRFVQSSDNKYVQYRLMSNEFSTDATQWAIDDEIVYVENPEFIYVKKDADDRLLWWIYNDGSVDWSKGVPTPIQEELKKLEQLIKDNAEGAESVDARITANEASIAAINASLESVVARVTSNEAAIVATNEALDRKVDGVYENSIEFIRCYCDADDRLLWWICPDGSVDWAKGVPTPIQAELRKLEQLISEGDSSISEQIEAILDDFSNIDDIENRMEMSKDADGRIISYRDSNGKLYENVGIETSVIDVGVVNASNLNLSKSGLNEFEQALKENGFTGAQGDWSAASTLHIPEPRCAMINITSADGKPYSWPTSKFVNNKVWVEFYDMQGNYFKKRAIHNAQGNSSMSFIKKNGAFDFCNDEWIGDDTFEIKFGDWVYQDSFHAKAYYTDFFRGVSIVAYKFADMVEKSRGIVEDRPWKKALLKDYVFGTDQTNSAQINDLSLQLNNEAKCHPDGFPCIMYVDGEFYGIYAFCIKKHRDNYHMKKDVAEHIHLDGDLYHTTIWNGTVLWANFEIRNPKNLYYKEAQNGTFEYDADVAQAEIAGDDEVNAWIAAGQLPDGTEITSKIKKRLQMTAKVKNYILAISQAIPQIKAASTTEEKKVLFNKYFDKDNLIDYEIVQMATGDTDGFGKNWQWTTYDGVKWYVNEYDKDMSFGGHFTGTFTQQAPVVGNWENLYEPNPITYIISLYQDEIVSSWKRLWGNVISKETILSLFTDWLDRIGSDNFIKEYEKWNESPCNRDDMVDTVHWKRTNNYKSKGANVTYDNTKTYQVGEKCYYGFDWVFEFECISESTGNAPITGAYLQNPKTLGYRDSFWRLVKYIEERLDKENNFINNF